MSRTICIVLLLLSGALFVQTFLYSDSLVVHAQSPDAFRMMTFNTEEEEDEMQDGATREFAKNVLNENVKIINLQEAENIAGKADAIQRELANRGRYERVYFASDPYMNNEDEMGIISLFPLEGSTTDRGTNRAVRLNDPGKREYANGWRTFLTVRAQTNKGPLRIFNVHPGYQREMGGECVEGDDNIPQFVADFRKPDEMAVIGGDFNANLQTLGVGDCGEWIDPNYIRTCVIQGTPIRPDPACPPSWNESNGKRGTLDHILISRNSALRMLDYKVSHDNQWNFSDHWPVFATLDLNGTPAGSAPPDPEIPPAASDFSQVITPAEGSFYPWSVNSGQGIVGPTAAWTNQVAKVVAICNGKWCWLFDLDAKAWRNQGAPMDIQTSYGTSITPLGSVTMFSNGGPSAGWEDYDNKYLSITNGSTLWLYQLTNNSWAQNGTPYSLPSTTPWDQVQPRPDGGTLFSGKGITAAWTEPINKREYFCNGQWCWVYNYARTNSNPIGYWERRTPFNLISSFKIAASATGSQLTTNGGPNVAWTDPVRNRTSVCSNGWCWSYAHKAGSSADLSDVTWELADASGRGTPYKICASFANSQDCGNSNLPTDQPDPTYPRGDFNQDNNVNQTDANLLINALGTQNVTFDLAASANNIIDIYDYNEFLKELK